MALERLFPKPIRFIVGIILDVIGIVGWISLRSNLQAWSDFFGWPELRLPIGFPIFLIPLIFLVVGTSLLLWDIGKVLWAWIQRPRSFAEFQTGFLFVGTESKREGKVDTDRYPHCLTHPFHQLVSHPTAMRYQLDLRCPVDNCSYRVEIDSRKLDSLVEAVQQNRLVRMRYGKSQDWKPKRK